MQDLDLIRQRMCEFCNARDWDKFHSPKNLSIALSIEASELLECFLWSTEEQSHSLSSDKIEKISDEIADIQLYLVRLADKVGIDIATAVEIKMKKNEEKYPVDKVKGNSKKYNEYE